MHYCGASLAAQWVKNPPANAGDAGLIPQSGRSPGEGNSDPLQYSCLEKSMDRGAWWDTVPGVAKESCLTWQQNNKKCISVNYSMYITAH